MKGEREREKKGEVMQFLYFTKYYAKSCTAHILKLCMKICIHSTGPKSRTFLLKFDAISNNSF